MHKKDLAQQIFSMATEPPVSPELIIPRYAFVLRPDFKGVILDNGCRGPGTLPFKPRLPVEVIDAFKGNQQCMETSRSISLYVACNYNKTGVVVAFVENDKSISVSGNLSTWVEWWRATKDTDSATYDIRYVIGHWVESSKDSIDSLANTFKVAFEVKDSSTGEGK